MVVIIGNVEKGRDYHARTHVTRAVFLAIWARFISRRECIHRIRFSRRTKKCGGAVLVRSRRKVKEVAQLFHNSRRKDKHTCTHNSCVIPHQPCTVFWHNIWPVFSTYSSSFFVGPPETRKRNVSFRTHKTLCSCDCVCVFFLCVGWFCALFLECTNFKNTLLLARLCVVLVLFCCCCC